MSLIRYVRPPFSTPIFRQENGVSKARPNPALTSPSSDGRVPVQPFQYTPLPGPSWIRLVTSIKQQESVIYCALSTFSLRNAPLYTALSYTWGSAQTGDGLTSERDCPIVINGKQAHVSGNLRSALLSRGTSQCPIWIDALCINQEDQAERASQVSNMGEVYSKAERVLVWLGVADGPVAVATSLVNEVVARIVKENTDSIRDTSPDQLLLAMHSIPSFWSKLKRPDIPKHEVTVLLKLLGRSWFYRAWVLQEVALARRIVVFCGDFEFDWETLTTVSSWLQLTHMGGGRGGQCSMMSTFAKRLAQGVPISDRAILPPVSELPQDRIGKIFYLFLQQVIGVTRLLRATDDRDHVFAPLALALHSFKGRLLNPPLPNYSKSVIEVFVDITRRIISHTGSLSMLLQVEDASERLSRHQGLPSWTPDFGTNAVCPLHQISTLDGIRFDCMQGCTTKLTPEADGVLLTCYGVHVDTVHVLGTPFGKTRESQAGSSSNLLNRPIEWLEFVLSLDPTYPTGEDSVQAFRQTIVAGRPLERERFYYTDFFDVILISLRKSDAFRKLVDTYMEKTGIHDRGSAIMSMSILRKVNRNNSPSFRVLDAFEARFSHTDLPPLPSFTFFLAWHALQFCPPPDTDQFMVMMEPSRAWLQPVSESSVIPAFLESVQHVMNGMPMMKFLRWKGRDTIAVPFWERHVAAMQYRRLFTSARGYIGLTPLSTREGDQVWMLSGCTMPLVLRKSMDGKTYKVVGPTYLHGLMNGEHWGQQDREFQQITII